MKINLARICFVMGTLLASMLVSCGGGGSSAPAPTDTLVPHLTLPSFPHDIEIYNPKTAATKAVVFLHGGGGRNYLFANDLGLNFRSSAPTSNADINWAWLNANKILAVFPQGQAILARPNAYTWDNHSMVSGQNDMAFLQALATYIRTTYGISNIYLAGHSNGGMMVNRIWCESPGMFKGYVSMSGPASDYYLSTPCAPGASPPPYYGIVGELDSVLQVAGNWDKQTWTIDPTLASTSGPAMPDPVLIGEWWQQSTFRVPQMCAEPIIIGVGVGGYVSDGKSYIWTNCSGHLKLQEVLSSEHYVSSLQFYSGSQMIDLIAGFINVP